MKNIKDETMKKVTVVIPTYNAEAFIGRCIDSVLAQTYGNVEVITVDDGSTDDTLSLLRSYGEKVKVLQNDVNQGPAYSRTRGVFEAQGEYVSFLDADDYWDKDFLTTTVAFLEKHQDAVAVSTGYIGINLKGNTIQKPNLTEEDASYYGEKGALCLDFFEFWSRYFAVLTGTVLMRTDIVKKTKGQRSELRLTEDLEFWAYLSTFGRWGFIPTPLFTTDPGILPPSERLIKMKNRYTFFADLNIDEWSKRIRTQIQEEQQTSYAKIINHIKTTIVIANAYSLRYDESFALVEEWKDDLDSGLGSVLRKGHALGRVIWPLICILLRIREVTKSYVSHFIRNY